MYVSLKITASFNYKALSHFMSQGCCFGEVVDVGELIGMIWCVCRFGLYHLMELSPAIDFYLTAIGLILANNQSAAIVIAHRRLRLLYLLMPLLQFRQTLLLLQTSNVHLLSDVVRYLYKNGNSCIFFWNRLLLLAQRHLPIRPLSIFTIFFGIEQSFSEFLLRVGNSFLLGGHQFLQAELPTALPLLQFCLVLLLQSAVAMLAPSEQGHRRCAVPHGAANQIIGRGVRQFGLLLKVLLLEMEQLAFEAELTVEELDILDVFELLWLSGWFPDPGGLSLHEGDVLLALLYFSAVEGGAFTLFDAALDQFREYSAAEGRCEVVRLLFPLVFMKHIELQKIGIQTTNTQRKPSELTGNQALRMERTRNFAYGEDEEDAQS